MIERVLSDYTAFLALEPGLGTLDPEETGGPTGYQEDIAENPNNLKIYPNPFGTECQVSYSLNATSHIVIEVFDLFGKRLAILKDKSEDAGDFSMNFDAGGLAAGIYICRLTINDSETITVKMVKK
jgi:hypothetical protein